VFLLNPFVFFEPAICKQFANILTMKFNIYGKILEVDTAALALDMRNNFSDSYQIVLNNCSKIDQKILTQNFKQIQEFLSEEMLIQILSQAAEVKLYHPNRLINAQENLRLSGVNPIEEIPAGIHQQVMEEYLGFFYGVIQAIFMHVDKAYTTDLSWIKSTTIQPLERIENFKKSILPYLPDHVLNHASGYFDFVLKHLEIVIPFNALKINPDVKHAFNQKLEEFIKYFQLSKNHANDLKKLFSEKSKSKPLDRMFFARDDDNAFYIAYFIKLCMDNTHCYLISIHNINCWLNFALVIQGKEAKNNYQGLTNTMSKHKRNFNRQKIEKIVRC